ncbi:RDD family protein [Marinobacter sp. C2H3]|uniref:RDD family protein n=1 Tax=Marinobacter sp. C2H3 TaxID=3119003 RepID=UPI00300E7027
MPRRFHPSDELLPPAPGFRRLLAVIYDSLIALAVLLVITWLYTLLAGALSGWNDYRGLTNPNALSRDPALTATLFLGLYLFFAYFWTRLGQTLGMQVWRIRVENPDGTSIGWSQSLRRFGLAAAVMLLALSAAGALGALSLLFSVPGLLALWLPVNGQSLTDRVSRSLVVKTG